VGYLCRRAASGALCGIAVLAVGLVSQLGYKTAVYGHNSVRPELEVAAYWAVLAICLGAVMGIAGVLSHTDRTWLRALAYAMPTSVAAVEVLAISLGRLSYGTSIAMLIALAAGILFVLGSARSSIVPMVVACASLIVCGSAVFALVQSGVPIF
jgi:hypothetical protein